MMGDMCDLDTDLATLLGGGVLGGLAESSQGGSTIQYLAVLDWKTGHV